MRINSGGTRSFIYATIATIIFAVCAFALIGWDQYETDRDNHRNMKETR